MGRKESCCFVVHGSAQRLYSDSAPLCVLIQSTLVQGVAHRPTAPLFQVSDCMSVSTAGGRKLTDTDDLPMDRMQLAPIAGSRQVGTCLGAGGAVPLVHP